jgi:hypothetical protein
MPRTVRGNNARKRKVEEFGADQSGAVRADVEVGSELLSMQRSPASRAEGAVCEDVNGSQLGCVPRGRRLCEDVKARSWAASFEGGGVREE